jgi:hypothetical protein
VLFNLDTHKSNKDKQYNAQEKKDKQYIENKRSSNTDLTKNRGWTQMLGTVKQFLLHMWHLMKVIKQINKPIGTPAT